MRNRLILAAMAATLLGGCATRVSPVEVTRFHLGQPIGPAAVSVGLALNAPMGVEEGAYIAAVERELARQGFSVVRDPTSASLIADVAVERGYRSGPPQRPPVSIGIGGGSFGGNVGVGGGIGFGLGGARSGEITITQLSVRLKRRAAEEVVWEGRARAEARRGTPNAQPGLAADKLARALFTGFPGESGRTINVP